MYLYASQPNSFTSKRRIPDVSLRHLSMVNLSLLEGDKQEKTDRISFGDVLAVPKVRQDNWRISGLEDLSFRT